MRFLVAGSEQVLEFTPARVVVAGYTGRNRERVEEHIRELERHGIPRPAEVPALYPVETGLLTQEPALSTGGAHWSGEAEPVYLITGGRVYVTVGSDITDRELERTDIGQAKQVCPKPVAAAVWPLEAVQDHWDSLVLRSRVGDGAELALYQDAPVSHLLRPADLLDHLQRRLGDLEGTVVFGGTVALLTGTFRHDPDFAAELYDPVTGQSLVCRYRTPSPTGRSHPVSVKEEFEFYDVSTRPWRPVPGSKCAGLFERILAGDPTTGNYTRMLKFEPGTDTSPNGTQVHDFWEEVYILEGSIIDLELNQEFTAGMYACRPPGMRHGPWTSPNGCITFEVRYTK